MSQRYYALDSIENLLEEFDRLYGNKPVERQKAELNQALADIAEIRSRGTTLKGNTRSSLKKQIEEKLRYL